MFKGFRLLALGAVFGVCFATVAHAVTVQLEVEEQGEPVPNAEISLETLTGEEIALEEDAGAPSSDESAQVEQPPQTSIETQQSATAPQPQVTTPVAPQPRTTRKRTRISTDRSGRAEVEVDEALRDQRVVVVVRRDGRVVSRRSVVLTGNPVSISLDVPTQPAPTRTTQRTPATPSVSQPDPFLENGLADGMPQVALTLTPKIGEVDTGRINLPVRLEVGGVVLETFAVDRDDEFADGFDADVFFKVPNTGGSATLGFDYLSSSSSFFADMVPTGAGGVGVLNPQGNGAFIAPATTLTDLRFKSDYHEFLLTPGYEFAEYPVNGLTVRPRVGFLYGETSEDSTTSFTVGGFFNARFEDEVESQRYGAYVGARISYPLTEMIDLYGDGELRLVYNDADGRSHAISDNAGFCPAGCVQDYSDSEFDIGAKLGGGVNVNVTDSVDVNLGGAVETWQIPVRSYPVNETGATPVPVGIEWEDRTSWTVNVGVTIGF